MLPAIRVQNLNYYTSHQDAENLLLPAIRVQNVDCYKPSGCRTLFVTSHHGAECYKPSWCRINCYKPPGCRVLIADFLMQAGTEETWVYPSQQMFFNALLRKGETINLLNFFLSGTWTV